MYGERQGWRGEWKCERKWKCDDVGGRRRRRDQLSWKCADVERGRGRWRGVELGWDSNDVGGGGRRRDQLGGGGSRVRIECRANDNSDFSRDPNIHQCGSGERYPGGGDNGEGE